MDNLFLDVVLGFVTGVVSGMGIGGGSVLIIVLVSFLGVPQLKAQGINLLYFLPTAASALVIHIKQKRIDWKTALWSAVPGVAIAVVFAIIAVNLEADWLRRAFAVLVAATGLLELFKKDEEEEKKEQKETKSECV